MISNIQLCAPLRNIKKKRQQCEIKNEIKISIYLKGWLVVAYTFPFQNHDGKIIVPLVARIVPPSAEVDSKPHRRNSADERHGPGRASPFRGPRDGRRNGNI